MKRVARIILAVLLFLPDRAFSLLRNIITALVQIWANKVRSLLTVLGIIIAVTSIITVVSLVEGFGNYVTEFLRGLGTNMMVVYPDWKRGPRGEWLRPGDMTIDDVRAVDLEAEAVHRVSPLVESQGIVEYGRQQLSSINITGASEAYQPIRNFYVDAGRCFSAVDVESGTQVCVLGREIVRKLEADESIVGDYILLDSQRFQVIGLLESKGSFLGNSQDEFVLIPWTAAVKMYPYRRRWMPFLVEATGEEQVGTAHGQITRILRQRHGLRPGEESDFGIHRQDQVLDMFRNVRTVATSVLAGIVSISLLVGGIGIMNVMLVSVTERTREIGLRKSVGARRRDILAQFLTEAVVLSTVGGAMGIALGYGLTYVASLYPKMVDVQVPLWSVALALGFSAGVGIFFGIIPAFKAAIIHPIDALRHE